MQRIYLDISNKGVVPTIYAKQGDVGRKFEVVLTDSSLPYVPANGSAFSVWYSGASGEGNYTDIGNKSAFSVNGNKVTVEMISQMLLNDGDGVLSLALNDPSGNQISTWNIPYVCEFVPGIDSEEAENYYTAFSNAVQNLPYPDASLSVAGKAADAAATGAALNGKAPAGYGLGEDVLNSRYSEGSAIDNIAKTGFYRWNNNIDATLGYGWFYGTFIDYGGDDGFIQLKKYGDTYEICRSKISGVWQPWEWVNPPMELGVEYRTAEKLNGKPVYAKALNFGAMPNSTIKTMYIADGITDLVRVEGEVSYSTSTEVAPFATVSFVSDVTITGGTTLKVTTIQDASNWNGLPIVYYCKG